MHVDATRKEGISKSRYKSQMQHRKTRNLNSYIQNFNPTTVTRVSQDIVRYTLEGVSAGVALKVEGDWRERGVFGDARCLSTTDWKEGLTLGVHAPHQCRWRAGRASCTKKQLVELLPLFPIYNKVENLFPSVEFWGWNSVKSGIRRCLDTVAIAIQALGMSDMTPKGKGKTVGAQIDQVQAQVGFRALKSRSNRVKVLTAVLMSHLRIELTAIAMRLHVTRIIPLFPLNAWTTLMTGVPKTMIERVDYGLEIKEDHPWSLMDWVELGRCKHKVDLMNGDFPT
eukprot:Gb_39203 [translate_table: standard]